MVSLIYHLLFFSSKIRELKTIEKLTSGISRDKKLILEYGRKHRTIDIIDFSNRFNDFTQTIAEKDGIQILPNSVAFNFPEINDLLSDNMIVQYYTVMSVKPEFLKIRKIIAIKRFGRKNYIVRVITTPVYYPFIR